MRSTKNVRVITEKMDVPRIKRMVVKTITEKMDVPTKRMVVNTIAETTEAEAAARFPVGAKVKYHEYRDESSAGITPEAANFGPRLYGGRVVGHEGSVVLIRRYRRGTILRYDLNEHTDRATHGYNVPSPSMLSLVDAPLSVPKPPSPKQVALKAERKAAMRKALDHLYDLLFEYGGWKEASPAQRKELLAADQAVAAAKKIGRRP